MAGPLSSALARVARTTAPPRTSVAAEAAWRVPCWARVVEHPAAPAASIETASTIVFSSWLLSSFPSQFA